MRQNLLPKESGIYSLFEKGTYFNAVLLERGLNEVLKIFATDAGVYDWDGKPLTAAQLWEKYYALDPGILREYLNSLKIAPLPEGGEKISSKEEKPHIADFFKANKGKIEEMLQ